MGRPRAAAFTVLLLLLVATLPAHAGPAKLVKDIARSSYGCGVSDFVAGPGGLYFGTDVHCRDGLALYRTDGTASGTHAVWRFGDASDDSSIVVPLAVLRGEMWFGLARDFGSAVVEIWRTDGSEQGTVRVWKAVGERRMSHGSASLFPREAVVGDRLLFFVVGGTFEDVELWVSDGSQDGTRIVRILPPPFSFPLQFLVGDGEAFFFLLDGGGFGLWRTDGTVDGTSMIDRRWPSVYLDSQPAVGPDGMLYFMVTLSPGTTELWRSGGTPETTSRVLSLPFATRWVLAGGVHYVLEARRIGVNLYRVNPDAGSLTLIRNLDPAPRGDNDLFVLGERDGILYVSQYAFLGARERLWRSDGTPDGTFALHGELLGDRFLPVANGFLFESFPDDEPASLWLTDGSSVGTRPLVVPWLGSLWYAVAPLTDAVTLFTVKSVGPFELWRTDGTSAGTALVRPLPSQPYEMAVHDGVALLMMASTLWRSDGTAGGTYPVIELGPRTDGSRPADLTASGDALYFTVSREPQAANELWRSDGSRAGTVPLANFPDGPDGPRLLTPAPTGLLFARGASELWASDGSAPGTRRVTDVATFIREILPDEGGAFLAVGDGTGAGDALLRLDETTGVVEVVASVFARHLVRFDGAVYFAAPNANGESALWRSDGSAADSAPLATFPARGDGVAPDVGPFFPGDGVLNFGVAWPGSTELWRSDGSAGGTTKVAVLEARIAPSVKRIITQAELLDGTLLFSFPTRPDEDGSPNLWRSDGTESGTQPVAAVPPFRQVSELTPFEGRIAFRSPYEFSFGFDGEAPGVWMTDGTEAGTERIFDGGVVRGTLVAAGGSLWFCGEPAGESPFYPYLFRSDGTAAGTVQVGLRQIPCRGALAATADRLFVPSTNARWGDELWSVPLDPP